jgi:hypothetical protein
MIGTSMMIASVAFFIHTVAPANATDTPTQSRVQEAVKNFQASTGAKVGKIQMSESACVFNGKLMYHILVWDTETDKSKIYEYNLNTKRMSYGGLYLPSKPLD